MYGLGDFLSAVAFLESRGNAQAGSDQGNAARGWFQLRPTSARLSDAGLTPAALKNERQAVALAAWYAWRLRPYAGPGQVIDWLALRRGWWYPYLVADTDQSQTKKITEDFATALPFVCVEPSFMVRAAFTEGVSFPGIGTLLALTQGASIA